MSSILITGANRGIGLAATLVLAKAGYTVHATTRKIANGAMLKEAIENEKLKVNIFEMDVTSALPNYFRLLCRIRFHQIW